MNSELGVRNSEFPNPAILPVMGSMSEIRSPGLLLAGIIVLLCLGCGKEGAPMPPLIRVAERTTDLAAFQEGHEAVLRWSYPSLTTSGQNLTDIEEIQVWRAVLPLGQEPPPPISAQDRQMQRQLLQTQGEILRSIDPEDIPESTRGSDIVIRDDLDLWRQSVEDPSSWVLWYGVRTVCCRHRESELSNVARLAPQAPPEPPVDLALSADSGGIELTWTPSSESKTLVERSPDGAKWTALTSEGVEGGSWKDEKAPQGQAWSYRLRSVVTAPGGGRVVGQPSSPARVDHPDTYPPDAPSNVVCLPEGAQVRIRWRSVASAAVYIVSRKVGDGPVKILAEDHRSIEFTDDEPPLGEIVYQIAARDAAGNLGGTSSCVVVMGAVP
jgi:hypothetical protein